MSMSLAGARRVDPPNFKNEKKRFGRFETVFYFNSIAME